jgi:aminomethyltransferase
LIPEPSFKYGSANMGETLRSPFHAIQRSLGATFMEEAGWLWTEGFGDTRAEHRAVREDLGIWDVSPLNKWDFRGPDALVAVQRLHTSDVLGLEDGQVRYGAFCDEDGLLIDDGTVFRFARDHLWVMTNGAEHQEHFAEATRGMNVRFEHLGTRLPHLGLLGPRARDALAPLCPGIDVAGLPYFRFVTDPVRVGGVPCWLSRTGFGGELGYELFCTPEDAEALWHVVVDATGATPFGVEAIEVLRIEAGLIILDYDYQAHTVSPFDVGLGRLVDLRRDFLGRDALREVVASPPNRWATLRFDSDALPEYGAAVTSGGEPVGTLTSPTDSPLFGKIGVAILRADVAVDGGSVDVALDGGTVRATVAPAPIYDTQKRRPRA